MRTSDLFFDSVVTSHVDSAHFLRRDWLAQDIQRQLDRDDIRVVLLTAAPGAGKSACLAQLAHDHPTWPRYFIRRDQRTPLADPTARAFLLRVGFQLASACPELFTTEQIRIEVTQRIGELADGGEVVGAEVRRLLTSPFHQTVLHIKQDVERAGGKATGLRIGEWVGDPRLVEPSDLQHMALFDPARALRRLRPGARLVVLVDALDEAAAYDGEHSLPQWLARLPELPPNLRLVVASRPSLDVTTLLEGQAGVLAHVGIAAYDDRVARDLRRYTRQLAARPPAARTLAEAGRDPHDFVREATLKANGNIGYLDALARAVDEAAVSAEAAAALGDLLALRELPQHITGLYGFFLRQIRATAGARDVRLVDTLTGRIAMLDAWAAVYRPLLEVLSIAPEPVGLDELRALGGIDAEPSDVATALRRLGQFLAEEEGRHRFYHATLAEFVTSPGLRAQPELHVERISTHALVARRLRHLFAGAWAEPGERVAPSVHRYGLTHCARHLYDGRLRHELFELLDAGDYGVAKSRADVTPSSYLADLALGIGAARHEVSADASAALPRLFRYALLSHLLSGAETTRAPAVHAAWMLLDDGRRVLKLIETVPDPRLRATVLADVAMALLGEAGTRPGDDRIEAALTATRAAVAALTAIADEDTALGALDDLLPVWRRLSELGAETGEDLTALCLSLADAPVPSAEHVRVPAEAATLLWDVDQQAARQLLGRAGQNASRAARSAPPEQLDGMWVSLTQSYAAVGQSADAEATIRNIQDPALRTVMTVRLVDAELRRGDADTARSRLDAAEESLARAPLDAGTSASARAALARGLLLVGDTARATALCQAAVRDVEGEELPSETATGELIALLDHLGAPDEAQRLAVRLHDAAVDNERGLRAKGTFPVYPLWAALALADADRPEPALAVMREMAPAQRAAPGQAVAAAFVRQGRVEEALAVVDLMRDAENAPVRVSVLPPGRRADATGRADDALFTIVSGLLRSGAAQSAHEAAQRAEAIDARSRITGALALHEIATGHREAARALLDEDEQHIRLMGTAPIRHYFTDDVLDLLARHGDWATAKRTAADADRQGAHDATDRLVRLLIDAGEFTEASSTIATIEDPLTRADALVHWAAKAGGTVPQDAVQALLDGQNLVRGLPAADQGGVLYRAGTALADLGELPAARAALRAAVTAWWEAPATGIVPSLGSRLAGALARVGLLAEADALADRFPDAWLRVDRARAWIDIARALEDRGHRAEALERLGRAVHAVRPGEFTESWDYPDRLKTLGTAAGLQSALGAQPTPPPDGDLPAHYRERWRAGNATALAQAGHPAAALALYGRSERPDDDVLMAIAAACTAQGRYADAQAQVERIVRETDRLLALAALATAIGTGAQARDAATRAAALFGEVRESPRTTRYCARAVGEALTSCGARDALRELTVRQWCGAVDALRLAILLPLAAPLLSAAAAREVATSVAWLEDFLSRTG
ncbi:hypothetical protein [Streptomyces sp. NPDC055243]|uniref:hypothetical protein n=1 Tax=Streptomyces sp. NPDC055243 TaxID=3365720 RepID=UPI0037D2434F